MQSFSLANYTLLTFYPWTIHAIHQWSYGGNSHSWLYTF